MDVQPPGQLDEHRDGPAAADPAVLDTLQIFRWVSVRSPPRPGELVGD